MIQPGPASSRADRKVSRREWMKAAAATGLFGAGALSLDSMRLRAADSNQALIGITLDLEMSANFPTRETTHWNFEKGNLNDQTKAYSVEAGKRVKQAGGVLHYFAVGQTFEQASVDWLSDIVKEGHPVGNHTYDHVNVTAKNSKDLQFRFQRSPWLLREQPMLDTIRDNIALTRRAMQNRLGIDPAGFRTPGGFANGLHDYPEVRTMLREQGFEWISSMYPPHPNTEPFQEPSKEVLDGIVAAQAKAQPFVYPDGLVEVPMSPISDIGAFRTGRWQLEWFMRAIRLGVEWAIDNKATYDFLAHPSCLYVVDPEFKTIELITSLVKKAGKQAAIVDLGTIAQRAKLTK